ncbi:MAG TPA: hypothetical protein VFZ44_16175 [Pyrinomonadaceae bacterium]
MFAGEKELSRRFAAYTDEELLRVLTADRAKYRPDALELAGRELSHRGLSPPPDAAPPPARVGPRAAGYQSQGRPKSPYQLIDLLLDAALGVFAVWAVVKLVEWTAALGGFWGSVVFCVTFLGLVVSFSSLLERWRSKKWRD